MNPHKNLVLDRFGFLKWLYDQRLVWTFEIGGSHGGIMSE